MSCSSPCVTPVDEAADVAVLFGGLLVERCQPFVEPRGALWKIRAHERMHNLMHQRAAAGGDVHHQRVVPRRIVTERRGGCVAKEPQGVGAITGIVLEEPHVNLLVRVAREIILLQHVHGPFHGLLGAHLDNVGRFVAQHDERPGHDDAESRRGALAQRGEVIGENAGAGGGRNGGRIGMIFAAHVWRVIAINAAMNGNGFTSARR